MAKFVIAVMGATGHVGHVVAEELLKKGHRVRAFGRNAQKLKELKAKGAEVLAGDFTDKATLAKAFKDCSAVFSFIPPAHKVDDFDVYRDHTSEAIANAIVKAKVPNVLNLSSMGAQHPSGTGVVKELHLHEERLNSLSDLNVLHLRPTYFMENFFNFVPSIKSSGKISSSLKAEHPIAFVATQDIGHKAAELLHAMKFKGSSVFEFVGPKAYTMKEATKIIGKAIGKSDLKYQQLSDEQEEKSIIAAGMTHQVAKLVAEMNRGFNEGKFEPTHKITPAHSGKTTFEEFAKVFAELSRSAKKAA